MGCFDDASARKQADDASARTQPEGPLTLLDLVFAVDACSESAEETVAVVMHLLRSGRVRLIGSFREDPEFAPADHAA